MSFRSGFFLFFLLVFFATTNAQKSEIELRKKVETSQDTTLLNAYLDLAKYYYVTTGKGDSLIFYGNKALQLSKSINYSKKNLEILKFLGIGHLANSNYDDSEVFFQKGLTESKRLNNEKYTGEFYNKLGVLFQNKGDNQKAIDNFLKAIPFLKATNDYKSVAEVYYGISLIYAQQNQANKQLEYLNEALNTLEEKDVKNPFLENVIYSFASQVYFNRYLKNKNPKLENKILLYTGKAIELAEKNNFKSRKAPSYIVLASYYNATENFSKAAKYSKEILKSKNSISQSSVLNAYTVLVENSVRQNNKSLAFKYLDSLNALKLKEEPYYASLIHKANYLTYKTFNNEGLALKFLELKQEVDKTLNDSLKIKIINELETKYQSEIKDAKITNLNNAKKINELEIENKKAKIKMLTVWLIVAATLLVLGMFILKLQELKKMRKKNEDLRLAYDRQIRLEKELSDVRDDIAQDFHDDLGNKLARISLLSNLVSGEASIHDPKVKLKIQQITEDANGLYRGTRDFVFSLKSNSDFIEEIATYLSDFGEDFFKRTNIKFTVEKDIERNDRLPHYWNKHLIFIFKEALTNTLKHSKCDVVNLSFKYRNSELTIICKDNGVGIDNKAMASQNGLANMKKRAEKIGCKLTIDSAIDKGSIIIFNGKIS